MPPYKPATERFWPKVNKAGPLPEKRPDLGPCWLWTAATDQHGYGRFSGEGRVITAAHRWAWLDAGREIPEGRELDHLCERKACVNPDHLEPVTHGVNVSRARLARTTCRRGHDLTNARIRARDGARLCRVCAREDNAAYRQRRKDQT